MVVRMDITPYVEALRQDLSSVADAAGPEARAVAERLLLALDPAVRLALVEALSHAAAEITSELPAGSIDVRMHGREPTFVVDVPAVPIAPAPGPRPTTDDADEDADAGDGAVARITLRIPEPLKAKAEELAAKGGSSLNTWIVNAVRAATRGRMVNVNIDVDPSSFLGGLPGDITGGRSRRGDRRMTGWV
jgi:hypothetical protein